MLIRRLLTVILVVFAVLGAACTSEATRLDPASGPEEEADSARASEPDTPVSVEPQSSATESAESPGEDSDPVDTSPDTVPRSEPAASPEPSSSGASAVLALLDALTVGPEENGGYDRDNFKHWIDQDNDRCDTRREVLISEAITAPVVGDRCSISGGAWISQYDGATEVGNGRAFDVDHMVPLKEAWQSGAHAWSAGRREMFANDLGYEHSLIAVSAKSNRSKGARDPAEWFPPAPDQRCWYAAAWVQVKTRWGLSADRAETDALRSILVDCSDRDIDALPPAPVVSDDGPPDTDDGPPDTAAEPVGASDDNCHPAYEPCLPNLDGDALNCGDLEAFQKPVTVRVIGVDPYKLDRDRNGSACRS